MAFDSLVAALEQLLVGEVIIVVVAMGSVRVCNDIALCFHLTLILVTIE